MGFNSAFKGLNKMDYQSIIFTNWRTRVLLQKKY